MFYKKYLFLFFIVFTSFFAITDLFMRGLPLTHDGQDHVARIANFYQNLQEGNIIPRWAGNLNWGYGHPILMFLYPLPSYLASLFHFFGFTLVDSVKIVFGIGFVASGLAMYIWIKEFLGTKSAIIGALLYTLAPYRFVDLYVRGAIGEHVAFIFPPLILYFLLKISKKNKFIYVFGGSLSLAGLILSHNAITLMFLPIILAYASYLLFTSKESFGSPRCDLGEAGHLRGVVVRGRHLRGGTKSLLEGVGLIMLLGFGLSSFFLIPAFFEGKYTLRDIVTSGGEYKASFVMWKDFFYSTWSYGGSVDFSKQIGIVHWVGIFGSIIATYFLYRNKNKLWLVSLGSLIIFGVTLFLMIPTSNPIWQSITLLQKFQFPWRFLSLTVFLSALLGAITFNLFLNKHKGILFFILILGLLVVNKDYWHANGFLHKRESFYNGTYNSTTDTGESAPIWSVRFMEKRPRRHIEVISGEAVIREISRKSTVHVYEINASEKSRILENTLYFPGWNVFVDEEKVDIEFQDSANRGLMTFIVDKGKHNVEVKFGETKLRLFADAISAAALGIVILLFFTSRSSRRLVQEVYGKKM